MRAGYIIHKHDPKVDREIYQRTVQRKEINLEIDLIWNCLMGKLNQPVQTQLIEENKELYERIDSSMIQFGDNIKSQSSKFVEAPLVGPDYWKRPDVSKSSLRKQVFEMRAQSSSKIVKIYQQSGSFLDTLKVESEYEEFREIFESIDIIKKVEDFSGEEQAELRDFNFDFDVYSPNSSHKKSDPPDYRLIILW